ncbi:MAG: TolB family protein, partial [Gaiellaceae bacterium]
MSAPAWELRFRTPVSFLPEWSPAAPRNAVYVSNESGVWQVHAFDTETGNRRQVTDHPVGLVDCVPRLDGEGALWFQDESGDESGRWHVQPFHGGETVPFLDGVPHGWNEGLAQAPGIVAAAISDREGFAVYVSLESRPAEVIYRADRSVRLGGVDLEGFLRGALSADGALLCLEHAEHGDLIHPALRVVDPRTGGTVAEQLDEGMTLAARCWSPVAGDQRLACEHERDGETRPAIWDLATSEFQRPPFDLEGELYVVDWWPDGSALLLDNIHEGRSYLYRYELENGALTLLPTEPGFVWKARVRPDGRVWLLHEQGKRQRLVLDDTGTEVLTLGE